MLKQVQHDIYQNRSFCFALTITKNNIDKKIYSMIRVCLKKYYLQMMTNIQSEHFY